jgi:hypothetical protein
MADEEWVALPAPDDKRAMLTSAGLLFYHTVGVGRGGRMSIMPPSAFRAR